MVSVFASTNAERPNLRLGFKSRLRVKCMCVAVNEHVQVNLCL